MVRTPDKAAQIERFSKKYRHAQSEVIRRMERSVFGCDYGRTSWTTRHEAENVGEMLALGPGKASFGNRSRLRMAWALFSEHDGL